MGEGIQRIIISKNKRLLTFCFLFITGASLFSWIESFQVIKIILFTLLIVSIGIVVVYRKNQQVRFVALCGVFMLFGSWRAAIMAGNCHIESNLCFYNDKMVKITGVILDEPDRRIDKTNYTITAKTLGGQPVRGRALVTAQNYPEFQYGDELEFTCRLQAPENKEDSTFRYDKYLGKENVWSLCRPAVIKKVGHPFSISSHFFEQIFRFKNVLDSQVSKLWPQPESGLMAGILYGSRSGLPPELVENFSNTGVTHIIAVSGFNITIIATILMSTLIAAGLWRRQAFWVALVSVWLFTTLSGLSASVVRAAVMGTLSLVAVRIGRKNEIGTVLVFTAAVMLVVNPFLLVWDAGFQLSFLATIGLVYISPLLEEKINVPAVFKIISEPLLTTLSAIIITLPLIMYQFGRLSLVAPLVNILILWIVPWLMLGGFVAVVASVIFFPIGQLVAYISNFGLDYVIKVAQIFGERSWSSVNLALPWWAMVCSYIFLFYYGKNQSLQLNQRLQPGRETIRRQTGVSQ